MLKLFNMTCLVYGPYCDSGENDIVDNGDIVVIQVSNIDHAEIRGFRKVDALLFASEVCNCPWTGDHVRSIYKQDCWSPFYSLNQWRFFRKIFLEKIGLLMFTTNDRNGHGHLEALRFCGGTLTRSLLIFYDLVNCLKFDLVCKNLYQALFINNNIILRENGFEAVEAIL
tara:strand:- start:5742 stop:6251 length:510 start_codon:yes stop_codon:yes gene_type:complete